MYLLDANTYIEAKNRYYQMSFCPAYWDWLDHQFHKGNLASISSIYDELFGYGDNLSAWANSHKTHFIDISDQATQTKFSDIARFVATMPNKSPDNIANFLAKGDPWLIAKASTSGGIVVTHEALADNTSKKVKIPNICTHFNVQYINTFELLNILDGAFSLQFP